MEGEDQPFYFPGHPHKELGVYACLGSNCLYGVCTLSVMAPPPPSKSTELLIPIVSFCYAGPGVILYLMSVAS